MERSDCYRNCWILGAIAGVVVLLFTAGIGDLGLAGGLFLGLVTFVLFGAMMVWLVCSDRPQLFVADEGLTVTDWEREAADRQPAALLVAGSLGPEAPGSITQMPIVAGALPRLDDAMEAADPVVEDAPAPEPAPAPVKKAPAKVAAAAKPGKGADDLQRIKGVGRKLSEWLHANGVTSFDQIAAWDDEAQAEFARKLGRRGRRIAAEDWVGQARILAAGGETAHSRAVDRGEAT